MAKPSIKNTLTKEYMLLIYSSKPHISRICMQNIQDLILENIEENEEVKFIHQIKFKNIHLNYSRTKTLSWKQLPCIFEPEYTVSENMENWLPMEFKNGDLQKTQITFKDVQNANKIIFLVDPSSSDLYDVEIFLNNLKSKPQCHFIFLYSLDKKTLETEFLKRKTSLEKKEKECIKEAKIKRFFTYNYNLNSMFIFGKEIKKNNIDNNKTFISKYGLQTMYFIQNNPMSENTLLSKMARWQGTGKYSKNRLYLGSMISISHIVKELEEYGFIQDVDDKIQLTDIGENFLSSLHKDCKDLDLPFRIALWQKLDETSAKEKISTYLKSYFGKQKKKLST